MLSSFNDSGVDLIVVHLGGTVKLGSGRFDQSQDHIYDDFARNRPGKKLVGPEAHGLSALVFCPTGQYKDGQLARMVLSFTRPMAVLNGLFKTREHLIHFTP